MRQTRSGNDSLGYFSMLLIIFLIASGFSVYKALSKWYMYKQASLVNFQMYFEVGLSVLMFVSIVLLAFYRKIGFLGAVIFSSINIFLNILNHIELKYIIGNIAALILLVVLTFMNWSKIR